MRPKLTSGQYSSACLVIVSCFAFLISLQRVYNFDIWWHLRLGEYALENLTVPKQDFLSFSTSGAPWVNLYWLSEPLFALLHRLVGIDGLLIFKSLLIAATAGALFLFIRKCDFCAFWGSLLVIWALELTRFRFMLRPLVFQFAGIVFLLWFLYLMERFRHRELLLFIVVVLWTGLHGSAFIGQVLLLFLCVEKMFQRTFDSPAYQKGQLNAALLCCSAVAVALFLNPNGLELYRMVYDHVFSDVITGSYVAVEEHQSLDVREHLGYAALVLLTGLSFCFAGKNFRPLSFMLFLAFGFLSFKSMRYLGLSSFVMVAVIAVNLRGRWLWLGDSAIRGSLARVGSLLLLVALCAGLLYWTFGASRVYEFGLGINKSRYPYSAVEWLQKREFKGNIYNSWRFGGFLQWQLPESKTFIDGRCLPEQLALYDRFSRIGLHDFARYMADHEVDAALVERSNQRDIDYFNQTPGFRLAMTDDLSVLFVRTELLGAEGAGSSEYRYLRLGGYEYEYLVPLAQGADAPLVEMEINAALRSNPENFFVNFLLGVFYDSRGDRRAAEQYALAARKNPQFANTHFNAGVRAGRAALKAENWSLAVEVTGEALIYLQTGELYFLKGVAEHKLGRLAEAEDAYRSSLVKQENPLVLSNLGFLLLERKDSEAAAESFVRLRKLDNPKFNEKALYGLALARKELADRVGAEAACSELVERYPGSQLLERLDRKLGEGLDARRP